MREIYWNVEHWDGVSGCWHDLGEARSWNDAVARVHGLKAADTTEQSYRVVEVATVTYGPKAGS
jgi:hypothetical protein